MSKAALLLAHSSPFQVAWTSFITQIAVLRWDRNVKLHCKNDTRVACLAETQLPWALLVSGATDENC